MKPFFTAVSSLPFVGKFAIGKELFEVYHATSIESRKKEYVEALILLIIMVLGHAWQAWMGVEGLQSIAPLYAKAYFGLYSLANASVTLTQLWLLWRVTRFHLTKPVAKRSRLGFKANPNKVVRAYAFTLAGQAIFMLLYSNYC